MLEQKKMQQAGGSIFRDGDLPQLHSTMQGIEFACTCIQGNTDISAAEATILSLSQSTHPYEACRFILENSQMGNARFQAASALRDSALREWSLLSINHRLSLIGYCLQYIMERSNLMEGYVRAKVSSVVAQLIKRGWLEFSARDKDVFLHQVNQAILGAHGVDVQYSGINFLESMVSEFTLATSSAMGLPAEFHEHCRRSLEKDYLKSFYSWAATGAFSVANKVLELHPEAPETRVCNSAVRLMFQILNWDFQCGDKLLKPYDAKRAEFTVLRPGSSWRDVLVSNGHTVWLLSFYSNLRKKFSSGGYWLDCPIAVSARNLIVQLCSLAGTVYESKEINDNYLRHLIAGVMIWMEPPSMIIQEIELGKSESELLDGCRALLSITTVTDPYTFDQLLKPQREYGTITFLSNLLCDVIKVLTNEIEEEETWSWKARDTLLDAWIALLTHHDAGSSFPLDGVNAAATVFAFIVEAELRISAKSAMNDDVESSFFNQASVMAMDERLSSYALIARAAINMSIPFLTKLFTDRLSKLFQSKGTLDQISLLEEMFSLLLIIGHVLADEGEGETPLIPSSIQRNFADVYEAQKHPVIVLTCSIINFAEQALNYQALQSIFSPRLMEALIWFLGRWTHTYLFPEEGKNSSFVVNSVADEAQRIHQSRGHLINFFGEYGQGKPVLDVIIRVSLMTLLSYPGENDLQSITCHHLLHALVRRKNICVHLVTLDSWRELTRNFANSKQLLMLVGENQRSIAQTLVLSAYGMRNLDASNQFVRDLVSHMVNYLIELSKNPGLKSIACQGDVILSITCLAERLRGAASASEPRTQKALFEMGFSITVPILVLLEVYKDEPAVVCILLKFVVEWVDGQISYLEPKEANSVISFCLRLLQIYSSNNIGKISISLSRSLLNESKSEKCKDLRILLRLLSSVASKDLIDFASESIDSQGTNISEVIYFGLHVITPLISLDLLTFPKLCREYFSLLSHVLEVYPEAVTKLQSDAFAHVLNALDFGLHHQDSEVVVMCLRAINALASYHYKQVADNKVGLASQEEGILTRFLTVLLHQLLFEDYSSDLIGSAADALFPLILCQPSLYQKLANELMEKQTNEGLLLRLSNAFKALTSANQITSQLNRVNLKKFRKNLSDFLIEVRGFLRTI